MYCIVYLSLQIVFIRRNIIFFLLYIVMQILEYKGVTWSCCNGRIKSATSFHIVSSQSDSYRENDRALNRRIIRHSNVTLTSARATEPSSFVEASHISSRGMS